MRKNIRFLFPSDLMSNRIFFYKKMCLIVFFIKTKLQLSVFVNSLILIINCSLLLLLSTKTNTLITKLITNEREPYYHGGKIIEGVKTQKYQKNINALAITCILLREMKNKWFCKSPLMYLNFSFTGFL